ncbi:MAG: zinc-binding dehydrogenase, partial [Streptomyces sp.]|nr:zinc-binding dehydrogenase [Streptomyces sp.]
RDAVRLLAPGGRHLVYGWAAGGPASLAPGEADALGVESRVLAGPELAKLTGTPEGLRELEAAALSAAADGSLVPAVQAFALADAEEAHRALESRATMGKVVLVT